MNYNELFVSKLDVDVVFLLLETTIAVDTWNVQRAACSLKIIGPRSQIIIRSFPKVASIKEWVLPIMHSADCDISLHVPALISAE